jgi:ATP-binding cassette subfamily B protein
MEEAKQKNPSPIAEMFKNILRVMKMIWQDKKGLIVGLVFIFILLSAIPFLQSGSRGLLINELIKTAGSGTITAYLFWLIVIFIFASIVRPLFSAFQVYLSKMFWFYLGEKMELDVLEKVSEMDVAVREDPKQNDLKNRVTENVWRVQNFVERQFFIFENIIEVAIASAIILFSNWWVFILILVGTVPELLVEARYGGGVWGIHSGKAEVRRRFWDLRGSLYSLSSTIELKIFQNIPYFLGAIRDLFKNFQDAEKKNDRKKLGMQIGSIVISQAATVFAIAWFIMQVVRGDLLIGTLTFILASISDLRMSLSGLFGNLGKQYADSLFVTDIFKFFDIKPAIQKRENGVKLNPRKTPEIIFENVSFSYPGATKPVLKNFSLKIRAGEKLAIVGINGAGKTTLVKLLCRFYDPTKGRILIDGHDLRDIDLESWYYELGIIFQDYGRYHFTVKEVIALGRNGKKSSLEKVKDAAQASEADIFIEEWERGYGQMLGKAFTGGVEPSVGQWQKLALARTFYRDPRILVLDEPTASIDAEAEAKIFEKLEALPKDRTTILISHRFSTVRKADKIAIIENGRLKELGSHRQLLKLKGTYARLFNIQAKGYK